MFAYLFILLLPQASGACLDAKVVTEIRQEIDLTVSQDLCVDGPANELLAALIFLKTTPLSEVDSPFSRNRLPTDAWAYFTKRISKIVNEPTCPMGKMASVHPTEPGLIRICPSFYNDELTIAERLPLLLHEAHHFDGDGFYHAHCQQGRLKGMRNACDESIDYGGGYAIELEALVRISRAPGLANETRVRARRMALERAAENFNEPIVSYRLESIYLEGTDGKGYLLDPELKGVTEVGRIDRTKQDVVSRGASLLAFPRGEDEAYTLDVLTRGLEHRPAVGSIALAFNDKEPSERSRVLAILNDDIFTGDVGEHRASVALAPNSYETEVEYPFTATEFYTGRDLGIDENSYYLRDENGQLNRVELKPGRNHILYPPADFPAGFKTFVYFQNRRLALKDGGELVMMTALGEWQAVLAGKRFVYASRPFYWEPSLFGDETVSF